MGVLKGRLVVGQSGGPTQVINNSLVGVIEEAKTRGQVTGVYGMVRGLGQTAPHGLILEVVGALLGRFFFLKRYGKMWRQYAPVLLAGFSCGMGLTGMFAMGITLILKSLGRLAY